MHKVCTAIAAFGLLAGTAVAQTTPATPAVPANPAVSSPGANNPGAPVPGANSFTESQAKARIAERGYSEVSGLTKDAEGIWRGKAMKDGRSVDVALDYQGNVVAR